jgi:prevent-host-death family protein
MGTSVWTVAQAKAKLNGVIEQATKHGPQAITLNGRRTAIVVSAEEWERSMRVMATMLRPVSRTD